MAFDYMQSLVNDDLDREDEDESDVDLELDLGNVSDPDSPDKDDYNPILVNLGLREQGDDWTDTLSNVSDKVEQFTVYDGPLHDLPLDSEPLDYFKLFFTDPVIDMIVLETNRYATQQQEAHGSPDPYWKPVTNEDIQRYLYINIMFGLHQLPDVRLYWSSDTFWRVPAVADVLGRQRYQKINQYFHLIDSANQQPRGAQNYDPLYKVRPLLDHVRNICSTVYKPMKDLSVDEAMIGYKGRLAFKQYIKSKPTPWGIKLWCCAEAKTGYVLNFQVYTGKQENVSPHGLGYHVVKTMMEPFLGNNHAVYFDNFFSSTKLAADLLDNKTYSCGTIRPNRKGWPFAKSKQKKGHVKMKQKGLMVATQWTDKRQVNVISTNCNPEMTTVERRTKAGMVELQIPVPVVHYNSGMYGVDLSDQHRSYYPVGRPSRKWWRYLVWYLVQVSIVNAFLLMKRAKPHDDRSSPAANHLVFRTQLARALINTTSRPRAPDTPTVAGHARPHSAEHRLSTMPGRKRRCYQCAKDGNKMPSGRTRETTTGCHLCNIHLHGGECYSKYHELIKPA